MDNDNHPKDNLENLFNGFFNDADKTNRKAGWNEPSDEVWARIQTDIEQKEESDRKVFYWWLAAAASLLLLITSYQLLQYNQKIQHLSEQLLLNEQKVQSLQSDMQVLHEEKTAIQKTIVAEASRQQAKEIVASEVVMTQSFKKIANDSNYLHKKQRSTQTTNQYFAKERTVFNDKQNEKYPPFLVESTKDNNRIKTVEVATEQPIDELAFLPQKKNQLAIVNRELTTSTINLVKPVVKQQPTFYISADYTPVLVNIQHKGEQPRPEFLPKKEIQETAYTTGLKVGAKWARNWSVETGLSYTAIQSQVQHNRRLMFESSDERFDGNGVYESNYNLQLGTSSGTVDADILLTRSSSTSIAEGTELDMNLAFSTTSTYLDLPIIVKKGWTLGRLELSVKAGVVNRFLIDRDFQIDDIVLNDIRFAPTHTHLNKPPDMGNGYHSNYLVGVGVDYIATKQLSVYAEPTFTRNIRALGDGSRSKIYAQNTMMNVGLRYAL